MNCKRLKNNLDNLRAHAESLRECIDSVNESGEGVTRLRRLKRKSEAYVDTLLKEYCGDFYRYNSKYIEPAVTRLQWNEQLDGELAQYELSGKADLGRKLASSSKEFKDAYGQHASLYASAELLDGSILLGGSRGALYRYLQDENHNWQPQKLNHLINKKNSKGKIIDLNAMIPLVDGKILIVSGESNSLYEFSIEENGAYHLTKTKGYGGIINAVGNDKDIKVFQTADFGTVIYKKAANKHSAGEYYSFNADKISRLKHSLDSIIGHGQV